MNESYRYTLRERLHDYHCDRKNQIKLGYILKFMEEVSTEHLVGLNLPYTKLYDEGIIFLMSKLAVKIYRRPHSGEEIVLKTSPQGTVGAQFLREVIIESPDGERLVEAISSWFIAEPNERKVLKPDAFKYPLPLVPADKKLTTVNPAQRIKIEGDTVLQARRKVYYSDLDVNGHMNNTVYADVVTDHLPQEVPDEREPSEFFIVYKNEALPGSELELTTTRSSEDGVYYVNCLSEEKVCFTAKITYK